MLNVKIPVLVVGSAAIGVFATFAFMRSARTASPSNASQVVAKDSVDEGEVLGPEGRELAELNRRIASLEAARSDVPRNEPAMAAMASPPSQVARRAAGQKVREQFRASVSAHNTEPVDKVWAKKTTALFQEDIAQVVKGADLKVGAVDCRTTTCLVRLEWPDSGSASAQYRELLLHPYRANCAKTVVLDEDSNSAGKAVGTLLLDCEGWRSEGEVPGGVRGPGEP